MISSKKKKVHQRVHHYTLSTTTKICVQKLWPIDISKKGVLNGRVRLSDSSTTSNGFGWHLTAIPERLSGCMLGVAIVPVLRHYGNHYHQSTVNAPFVTLIFVSAYEQVLPQNRHRAVGEESGKMNRIERFNLTLRQRISRLVRKTLSFSKKIEAHTGAIWNFIHYYNAEISPKLSITTY